MPSANKRHTHTRTHAHAGHIAFSIIIIFTVWEAMTDVQKMFVMTDAVRRRVQRFGLLLDSFFQRVCVCVCVSGGVGHASSPLTHNRSAVVLFNSKITATSADLHLNVTVVKSSCVTSFECYRKGCVHRSQEEFYRSVKKEKKIPITTDNAIKTKDQV